MTVQKNHEQVVEMQFGDQAQAYLQSEVHAQGADLQRLTRWLQGDSHASVLDVGCGAGHASFVAAGQVARVMAYDLSAKMLAVVSETAAARGLSNIDTCQGSAEKLPFADASFDRVISRYSAHHWHDVGLALREIKRVLKPGGSFILMDIASPGQPVLDIFLQTVEMLRDPSHVRDYSQGEWLRMVNDSGLTVKQLVSDRLSLEFSSWVARMKTPQELISAIRLLQQLAPAEVSRYYVLQPDGSFSPDTIMFLAQSSPEIN